jgi:hypothetical protein
MGARTNFEFKTDQGTMTLYSHWGGESKAQDLASALYKAENQNIDGRCILRTAYHH